MKYDTKRCVKIRLNPDPTCISPKPLWLHVEWFGTGRGREVDRYWLTENETEATPIEPFRAKRLAAEARTLAWFDGDGDMKAVYMAKAGRKWVPTTLKKALAGEAKTAA